MARPDVNAAQAAIRFLERTILAQAEIIDAVLHLHQPSQSTMLRHGRCVSCQQHYPCETVLAVQGDA